MTDIRQREDVLQVYWYMMGKTSFAHVHDAVIGRDACRKCHAECAGQDNCEFCTQPCPVPDPITMSIGDLAFFMRDKCEALEEHPTYYLDNAMYDVFGEVVGYDDENDVRGISDVACDWFAHKATPEQWIEAAIRAWNSKAADAAGDE